MTWGRVMFQSVFFERQRLPRPLDLAAMLGSLVGVAFCVWFGENLPYEPSWAGLAAASAVLLVLGFGMEMRVRVRDGAVVLMLTPVYRKVLPASAISGAYGGGPHPGRIRGGRGLRCRAHHRIQDHRTPGRLVLMLHARSSVELRTVHGRTYVVGTARPQELLYALRNLGVAVYPREGPAERA
ncbi:hypothetical protein [Streptomyces sp. ODS28]|uniref:hypothetical protein n=1 Tax=Streptomyces sp. ODS28 TaxID=3136688 RepID=UPI0031F1B82F